MSELRQVPDGVEVTQTIDEAKALASPPLLVVDAIDAYLDDIGFARGPLSWRRIGDGQSNVTYELRRGDERIVLRRGPRPPFPPSAHNMEREARIQRAVAEKGAPVPEILSVCTDESVLGVPFYLMGYVDGEILGSVLPDAYRGAEAQHATAEAAIDALVALHAAPLEGAVAEIGRPAGYLSRQVERFGSLWAGNTRRSIPKVDRIAEQLASTLPDSPAPSVVHGDYRFGNIMLTSPGQVGAILDWEMATLGDPLADLGYFAATYSEASRPDTVMHLTPLTAGGAFPPSAELVARYADLTGRDVSALPWYRALAMFKSAVFCEAIYTRWLDGERPDDTTFAPLLEAGVPGLLDAAEAALAELG